MNEKDNDPSKAEAGDGRTEAQKQAEKEWLANRIPNQQFTREQVLSTLEMLEKNHMDLLERLMEHERKGEMISDVGPELARILDKLPFLTHTAFSGSLLTRVRAEIVRKYEIKIPGMRR